MITLYSYRISPYAAKVRAILRHKQLPFEEKMVHPLERGLLAEKSGQRLVPVLEDDGRVIADSTKIARYLDERYPARPVIPADPLLRARVLLYEEWADEGLPRVVQPVRWFIPANAEKTLALFRGSYAAGTLEDLRFAVVARVLRRSMRRKYGPMFGRTSPAQALNRLAEGLDVLDRALAETGWLCGPEPTVADFAAWGFLHLLEGLDGWETVKIRRRVVKLIHALKPENAPAIPEAPEAYDAEDAALLDASQHRRASAAAAPRRDKRLPLV